MPLGSVILGILGLVAGGGIGLFLLKPRQFDVHAKEKRAIDIVENAKRQSMEIVVKAASHVKELKEQFSLEEKEFAAQIEHMDKMLETKVASFQKRETKIKELKANVEQDERSLQTARATITEGEQQIVAQLLARVGMTNESARTQITARYENDFLHDAELRIAHSLEGAQESAMRDARAMLGSAVVRYNAIACRESNSAKIIVLRDEVKGRLVGRGGRLIAYFEELFGVDVIFNDEPSTIIVSCFNLVQQEIARLAIERLMKEKVITEQVIDQARKLAQTDMERVLEKEGQRVLATLGVSNMSGEFARLVGRLRFRTSYGQNVLRHCYEVGFLSRMLASEIGADEKVALLGGFFHDIGKAIDQEVGGAHDVLTKEILEKYEFSWEITHAAWTHHNAIPQETLEARLVQAADALSAGRPGARAESVERYSERIHDLQDTALGFSGVRKAYAINAGREVRVVVDSERVNDEGVVTLAAGIAQKVQEKGGYPGKIKIVAIRTTKTTEYARGRSKV